MSTGIFFSIRGNKRLPSFWWIPTKLTSRPRFHSSLSCVPRSVTIPFPLPLSGLGHEDLPSSDALWSEAIPQSFERSQVTTFLSLICYCHIPFGGPSPFLHRNTPFYVRHICSYFRAFNQNSCNVYQSHISVVSTCFPTALTAKIKACTSVVLFVFCRRLKLIYADTAHLFLFF